LVVVEILVAQILDQVPMSGRQFDALEAGDMFGQFSALVVMVDQIARIRRFDASAIEFVVHPHRLLSMAAAGDQPTSLRK
jgi:hypothetical protein